MKKYNGSRYQKGMSTTAHMINSSSTFKMFLTIVNGGESFNKKKKKKRLCINIYFIQVFIKTNQLINNESNN